MTTRRPWAWHRAAATRRGLLWLLLLALLHAQGLGLWHRVAHAQRSVLATQADDSARQPFGHGVGDEAQCRLYDQLAASDAVGMAACAAGAQALPAATPLHHAVAAPRAAAAQPYQARAPPRG